MKVSDADATVAIVDGRVAMNADGDVSVYVQAPDAQPLTEDETHARLRFVGEGYRGEVEFDADALEGAIDALEEVQGGNNGE
ncbi:hypothetical protein [Haloferax gibbonsii]|uniref:Uncharacterized protein n=1 Tax=Haloferax gibbonsii TaxID=35746 RepID=A0A0K1IZJ6_HALGI|nr:hypothetical protein [Haloferax gibbonsii]AKU09896.1 hypothetical protein ABY42_18940 [Haloferax gibbonsii]